MIRRPGRFLEAARRPVPADSSAAFRVCFGLLAAFSSARFLARGWVDILYLAPEHHLTYPGFGWVRPWPAPWMHLHMTVLIALGLCIALGWHTRIAAWLFTAGFAYTELIDATLYLNHYWYMTLAGVLVALLPVGRRWSLDARAGRVVASPSVQAAVVWALRSQVAVVYVFAGLAKLNGDWLWRAQPLRLWLADRTDLPVIGGLLDEPAAAYLASWSGAAFDCTIVGWLLWRRTRPWAFAVLAAFHATTGSLFPAIGVFPWVMTAGALVFFRPDWPSRLKTAVTATLKRTNTHPDDAVASSHDETSRSGLTVWIDDVPDDAVASSHDETASDEAASARRDETPVHTDTGIAAPRLGPTAATPVRLRVHDCDPAGIAAPRLGPTAATPVRLRVHECDPAGIAAPRLGPTAATALTLLAVVQVLLPLRHYAYPGDVRWTEEGYYLSWRVMLTEKTGYAQFHVTDPDTGRSWLVTPELVLEDWQAAQAVIRPDLLRATARLVADHYRRAGIADPQVRVDAWVSLNGAQAQRIVDPDTSLTLRFRRVGRGDQKNATPADASAPSPHRREHRTRQTAAQPVLRRSNGNHSADRIIFMKRTVQREMSERLEYMP